MKKVISSENLLSHQKDCKNVYNFKNFETLKLMVIFIAFLIFHLKEILKYTDHAGDDIKDLQRAVEVMCVIPKAANDMMNVGRLQGFVVKLIVTS